MPIIARLAHPVHGEKDASTQAEVDEAKVNGWEVVGSLTPPPPFTSVTSPNLEEEQAKLDALKHQVKGETTKLTNLKAQVKEEQAKLDALKASQPPPPPPLPGNLGAIVNTLPGT